MSRFDFMKELESLLSDIPIEERNEALQYYNDYFEDAGVDHEDEIMKELGSPARIAGIIKADLNANAADHDNRGVFTEKGYQDTVYTDEKYEIVDAVNQKQESSEETKENTNKQSQGYQQAGANGSGYNQASYNKQKTNNTNLLLIIIICIFAIPIGLPLFFSVFGIVISLIVSVFALLFGFGIAGMVMVAVGIALFVVGIAQISIPYATLVFCGSGLLVFGLGILFVMLSALLLKKVVPAIIKGIVNLFRIPFRNRSVAA